MRYSIRRLLSITTIVACFVWAYGTDLYWVCNSDLSYFYLRLGGNLGYIRIYNSETSRNHKWHVRIALAENDNWAIGFEATSL